ncbi:fungal-specific transcription factor domain-containing protein [Xylariales sp. PMI_506]|nr:fungal-specific transcription factor domain-containing protein [Xylariales sp. PMI_506]
MTNEPASARHRQKRIQVARACDACRIHRVKCDNSTPCFNCRTRGRDCSNSGSVKTSTLTEANDEVNRLRKRVKELESVLQNQNQNQNQNQYQYQTSLPTPEDSMHSSTPSEFTTSTTAAREPHALKTHWDGILIRPPRSPRPAWFGPSSLYHFTHRLSTFLRSTLQLPAGSALVAGEDPAAREVYLPSIQEEYFLNLFWESYHTSLFPIIDEAQFRKDYQALWVGDIRRPSALVDIMVAMGMQYGLSALPAGRQGAIVEGDATTAGRWHYRRAQRLLAHELESPTITTLQCHVLCAVYLCGGSFHNMVDTAIGLAVRTAYILGLHLDASLPERDLQVRRRLWWTIVLLDSKTGMKLGRPFLLQDSHSMPALPSDSREAASLSGSSFAPVGSGATWLSFHLHHTKLYAAFRAAHSALYGTSFGLPQGQTPWEDYSALEACADVLQPHTAVLQQWCLDVPAALQTRRRDGQPLSTDGSPLEFEQFSPVWLQRQRLLLEMAYHHLAVGMYRPLISFEVSAGPRAEQAAAQCAAHAIALTKIIHQAQSETPLLDGWHEAFQWQWSAAISLAGFLLAYPQSPIAADARSAIDLAVAVFDVFGRGFAVATSAATIVRDLCTKVDAWCALASSLQDPGVFAGQFDMDFDLFGMALDVNFSGDLDFLWPELDTSFAAPVPLMA